ncbi:MAG: CHRD domain-containing protein [Verrucomicrobiales bacterium]|nr:CHRD domain-containing protein [Verrucomicrobiales bacterium]
MKKTLSLLTLCSALAVAQADIVKFNLAPDGLNPGNVVPAVTNSTGSGNTISGGIALQTTNSTLSFAVGYGAAAGFSNLTGQATAVSLNGPAPAGTNAAVLFDLSPFTFPAIEPTNGGVIFGSVVLTSEQSSNLLAGLDYIVIATDSNTNGEIRGQLVPIVATVPTLVCPGDFTMECTGQPTNLTAQVSSATGDALTVTWTVNGVNVQTNQVPQGSTTNAVDVVLAANLELGTNIVGVTVADSTGGQTSCESTIIVQDTIAPVIINKTVSPAKLWPPNHKMVPIRISVVTQDACCVDKWTIVSVTSNETVIKSNGKNNGNSKAKGKNGHGNSNNNGNGNGSGNTSPDWIITGDHGLSLRAERAGTGSGRVYTITVQAQDCAGNLSAPATLTVTVPHDQGKGK